MIRLKTICQQFLAVVTLLFISTQANAYTRDYDKLATLPDTISTEYFVVNYDPKDPYLPQLMSETARIALLRVASDLGYKPEKGRPFVINVYRTHHSFIKAGGLEDSKFTVGTASSHNQTISVDASGVFASPKETIAHEITHVIIFRMLGQRVVDLPLWVNEGIAQYESEEYPDSDNAMVAEAAADGRLLPLANLEKRFPKDKTGLAYAQSASAVRFMAKKHGKASMKIMLKELARGRSFDQAMTEATGRTGDRFVDDWQAEVTKRHWALKITRIGTAVISVVMAILVVIAFLVRRKQKIEAAKRWEWEEFDEAMRRQLGNDWWR